MRWWLNHILLRLEKKGLFSSGMSGRTKAAPLLREGAARKDQDFRESLFGRLERLGGRVDFIVLDAAVFPVLARQVAEAGELLHLAQVQHDHVRVRGVVSLPLGVQ